MVAIKRHTITVQCGGIATTGQAERGKGSGREPGSRLEWEQGDKQGKAHNPPVYSVQTKASQQWHTAAQKEGKKNLEICPEKY